MNESTKSIRKIHTWWLWAFFKENDHFLNLRLRFWTIRHRILHHSFWLNKFHGCCFSLRSSSKMMSFCERKLSNNYFLNNEWVYQIVTEDSYLWLWILLKEILIWDWHFGQYDIEFYIICFGQRNFTNVVFHSVVLVNMLET